MTGPRLISREFEAQQIARARRVERLRAIKETSVLVALVAVLVAVVGAMVKRGMGW